MTMKDVLLWIANKITARYGLRVCDHKEAMGRSFFIPQAAYDLIPLARDIGRRHDLLAAPGTSGEWKRDRTFEQIINTHPEVPPKLVHLAVTLSRWI
jgi:hypothetical protein